MSLPLYISNQVVIVLSMPIVVSLAVIIFKREIYELDFNSIKFKKTLSQSLNILTYVLAAQAFFNIISMFFFDPVDKMAGHIPIVIFYSIFFAPILEETVFRYIIFGLFQRNKEKFSILTASISSLLFALMHFNVYGFLGYLAVGFIFCYAYYRTKNILVLILTHTYINFLVIFMNSLKQYI